MTRDFAGAVLLGLPLLAPAGAVWAGERDPLAIEVRMEARDSGKEFAFADGAKVVLEAVALLEPAHFGRVEVRPSRNPNTPGASEIEAFHNGRGRWRLQAAAGFARDRRYCVLVRGVVQNCSGFAPEPKRIFDRSQTISVESGTDARGMARAIQQSIAAELAADRALSARTRTASPRALLELLYRRTLAAGGSQWISGGEREAFLSRALVELWDKVDARIAAGDNEAVLDADPVTSTNGLEMKSYRVVTGRLGAGSAIATVTVNYGPKSQSRDVRYSLLREAGGWRIGDIGSGETSLKANLARFVQ